MQVHFLGTSGSIPTRNRNLVSVAIKRKGKIFLFDPGEGTQQQMIRNKLSVVKTHSIYVSHLHGDHIMGIPGIIMSAAMLNREKELLIFGPPGTLKFIQSFLNSVIVNPSFKILVKEVAGEEVIFKHEEFQISSGLAEHTCFCLYYIFEEKPRPGKFNKAKAEQLKIPIGPLWKKLQLGEDIVINDGRKIKSNQIIGPPRLGRKIIIALDTRPTDDIRNSAQDADLLIFDGTFDSSLKEKAVETKHSTVREAAQLANEANVKRLALTHYSSRYKDLSILKKDIENIRPNAIFPDDLTKIKIPYSNGD
ncbi:MAG: ribonuclease Z [Candidatus Lokiarchaeota archaeon]|nr:ribonuclease Z [Candidatus Lokiarchaeota archaeon]